jgi:hypothetical protein
MAKHVTLAQHTNAIADKRDGGLINAIITPMAANLVVNADRLSSRTFNAAGLAIGSASKKKIKIVNETLCCVNGTMVLIAAATEAAFTATTQDIADGYTNMYVLVTDSAGTVSVLMGTAALTTTGIVGVVPPTIPANRAVIGIVTIATAGGIFDATTTDLDAGTVTDLYYDIVGAWDPKASTTV